MPSLNVPRVPRTKSASSISSRRLNSRRCGTVDSPTPMMPISSDSTSVTCSSLPKDLVSAAAVIHPELPPPTITTERSGSPAACIRSPLQLRGEPERALEADDGPGRVVCRRYDWRTARRGEDGIVRIVVVEVEYVQDIQASGSPDVLEDREPLRQRQVEV